MSAVNHTAGPWTRDRYGHVVGPNGENVRFRSLTIAASGSEERMAEAEANTDLATAAPELLEEHQQWAEWLGEAMVLALQGDYSKVDELARSLRLSFATGTAVVKSDAIAKATKGAAA